MPKATEVTKTEKNAKKVPRKSGAPLRYIILNKINCKRLWVKAVFTGFRRFEYNNYSD